MNKSGQLGEDLAVEYLKNKGYEILQRNWRGDRKVRAPELDIIALHDSIVVFVEVKTASTGKFGKPEHWITMQKRARLKEGAVAFLSLYDKPYAGCRFDAIIINLDNNSPDINHIKNAFLASDI